MNEKTRPGSKVEKKALLTGASGYIAKHVVLQLLQAGYSVRGSVRSESRGEEVKRAIISASSDGDALASRFEWVLLDLSRDEGWSEALRGVDVLVHTASPFPMSQPTDEQELIRPAVDGTLRALRAAHQAGVRRVVLTSSIAAVLATDLPVGRRVYDERDFSDTNRPGITAYLKSKTLAEQAAWKFVRTEGAGIQLTTINPGLVIGPPLDEDFGTSVQVIERILRGTDPAMPRIGFSVVDVRDIAAMHVAALRKPESIGLRIIGISEFVWFIDLARALKEAFPRRSIPTREAPSVFVRIFALFDSSLRTVVSDLDRRKDMSNERARKILGIEFRDARSSAVDTGRFLVDHKLV